jgi:hypothetical protein
LTHRSPDIRLLQNDNLLQSACCSPAIGPQQALSTIDGNLLGKGFPVIAYNRFLVCLLMLVGLLAAGGGILDVQIDYDVTVDALRAANGLTGNVIVTGQALVIPSGSALAVFTAVPTSTPAPPVLPAEVSTAPRRRRQPLPRPRSFHSPARPSRFAGATR